MILLPGSLKKWQTSREFHSTSTITSASPPTSVSIYSTFPPSHVVLVQSPSCVWFFVPPWAAACQASLSLIISQSLPKFTPKPKLRPNFTGHCVLSHSLNKRHWSRNFPFCLLHYQFFSIWSLSSKLKHWNDICYFLISSIKTLFTAILLLLFPFSYSFYSKT